MIFDNSSIGPIEEEIHMLYKFILFIAMFALTGCANMSNQETGLITGAAVGGVLGHTIGSGTSQVVATAAGVLVGAYIGGRIGESMDKTDRLQVGRALEGNKTGRSRRWRNPDSGARYSVTPTRTYIRRQGRSSSQPCREFTTTAKIGGNTEKVYGTACRMDDGSWKIKE